MLDWNECLAVERVPGKVSGSVYDSPSNEGTLHWVPREDVLKLNLWAGDRHFISYVMQEKPFMGTIWYRGQDVERWWVEPLGL